MPETGRQKQQLSNQLVGLDAHRMDNVESNELEIDGSRYFHPGEEHKDGGVFGATRILVNDQADWIVVKQSNGMVDANGRTIGNTIEKEAAFSRLADSAANGGKSRVAAARAIGRSKEDGEPDLLVMDLMAGGNVKRMTEAVIERMRAKQLTYEEVVIALTYLCRETALGVAQIAAAGFVHMDLKPDNLLLDDNMDVKIGDFGCAAWEGDTISQGHNTIRAPEVSQKKGCTFASDVYSLGKTFQMIAGEKIYINSILSVADTMLDADPSKRPTAQAVASQLSTDDVRARKIMTDTLNARETAQVAETLRKQREEESEGEEHEEGHEEGHDEGHDEGPNGLLLDDYFATRNRSGARFEERAPAVDLIDPYLVGQVQAPEGQQVDPYLVSEDQAPQVDPYLSTTMVETEPATNLVDPYVEELAANQPKPTAAALGYGIQIAAPEPESTIDNYNHFTQEERDTLENYQNLTPEESTIDNYNNFTQEERDTLQNYQNLTADERAARDHESNQAPGGEREDEREDEEVPLVDRRANLWRMLQANQP